MRTLITRKRGLLVFFSIVITFFSVTTPRTFAQCSNKDDCANQIKEYEAKIGQLQEQKNTLSSQINLMNAKISLTTSKIKTTEYTIEKTGSEIESLGEKIVGLNSSLDYLTRVLLEKIVESYKNKGVTTLDILLDSQNAGVLGNKIKYLDVAQNSDRRLAFRLQQTKENFEEQKNLREEKKTQLEELTKTLSRQKIDLDNQKVAKQQLLTITKNDEKTYQSLLAKAQSEYAAIQGIVAGSGTEVKLRDVSKGEGIATVIQGASCNSSGSHLHFIVQENGATINPFSKLKQIDAVNESNGDPFNPSGSWDWPLPATIHLHQGYGDTWFVRTYRWYGAHNGIDITGGSNTVSAVESGTLFRGSFSGKGGCALPYVRVNHAGSNISTLYLHVYAL